MKKLFCAVVLLCVTAAPGFATTRILFIGNSFTFGEHSAAKHYETDQVHDLNPPDALGRTLGGAPALFKEFTREAGLDYDVSLETAPGKGLDYHLAQKRDLINRSWEIVIAQGYSTLDEAHPGDPALLIASTRQMADMLMAQNPHVKFYLAASWSRADKVYPANAPPPWRGTPITQMARDVQAGYEQAARSAGVRVAGVLPVGAAWNAAIEQGLADGNPYDDLGASKMNLWAYDSYHASVFGYYLEALVEFGRITGVDPQALAGKDHVAEDLGISPVQSRALMTVAHDTLAKN